MAKYTEELRDICMSYSNFEVRDIREIINIARGKIFDFEYPIFDESYRLILETKILRHYYTREIAHETYGLWKFRLENKLNEIMPYYNKLYESELLEFNPFYDMEVVRSHDRKNEEKELSTGKISSATNTSDSSNSKSEQDNVDKSINKFSATPQGSINDVENGSYLTDVRIVENQDDSITNVTRNNSSNSVNNVDNSSTNDVTNIEEFLESVKGKQGGKSYSEMLVEFRKTFMNIDMLIINELSELFFNLW